MSNAENTNEKPESPPEQGRISRHFDPETPSVLNLVIDRPHRKNALTHRMYAQLFSALQEAEADASIRVVHITGRDGMFTAGNDLGDFAAMAQSGGLDLEDRPPVLDFLDALVAFRKPLVASVPGFAVGVGTTMLLHCDFVLASENAVFSTPFVDLGLVPEAASSLLLPAAIGRRRAAEMLLLGERLDAATAAECGLVNRVHPAAELPAAAAELCQRLASKAPTSLRASKALLKRAWEEPAVETMREENAALARGLGGDEFAEAVRAFTEKRPPDFSQF